MKLIICGNGFDQHHRLPTNYTDYCEFLNVWYPEVLEEMGLSNYFQASSPILSSSTNTFWTDVEKYLVFDFIGHMDYVLEEYRDDPDDDMVSVRAEDGLGVFRDFTGEPFYEWLLLISSCDVVKSEKFVLSPDDYYVTFNYTDTLEKVYEIPDSHILHIHGSIDDVVLTEGDFASEEARRRVHDTDVHRVIQFGNPFESGEKVRAELREHYNNNEDWNLVQSAFVKMARVCDAMSKSIESNYEKLRNFLSEKIFDEVVVMGHSFLGVDRAYYENVLVELFHDKLWTFYWYSEEDRNNACVAKEAFKLSNVAQIQW